MQQHVRILAILNIIYGAFGILIGLIAFVFLGGMAGFFATMVPDVDTETLVPILQLVGVFVLVLLVALSIPSIIAGWGLLNYRPWARILTIVLCALHLLSFPFGTALGVYGLWVLLQTQTEALFLPQPPGPPLPSRPY
jgi:hypothetical protein